MMMAYMYTTGLAIIAVLLAAAAAAGSATTAQVDPDLAWMRTHTLHAMSALQTDSPPPLHFARASDAGRPADFMLARSRDLAMVVHFAYDTLDSVGQGVAVATAGALLNASSSADGDPTELPSRAWLLAGLAKRSAAGKALLCVALPPLWAQLDRFYGNVSQFKDSLVFSAVPAVGAFAGVLSSGHDTMLSMLHAQALGELATVAATSGCGDAAPSMRAVQHRIVAALQGPLLWNDAVGMFRPSSGNNAVLTCVWGSALAVEIGAVTSTQAARIVEWFVSATHALPRF
jgi:hypothetical protein